MIRVIFVICVFSTFTTSSDLTSRIQSKFIPSSFVNIFEKQPSTNTPPLQIPIPPPAQPVNPSLGHLNANANANANTNNYEMPASPMQFPPKLPFPRWLHDFTGLSEWPDLEPPYIPLDFINFDKIEPIPTHQQAQCSDSILRTPKACSFDCFNCVEVDDVYTCPKLSQTFDDGPSPHTIKLLDAMSGTKTTLFTLGVNIIRFPEVYQESYKRGHIMGSHTWSHKFLPSLSNEDVIAQIEWSIWAMNATSGHLPKWFRPPYGGIDNRIRSILRQFGMQAVLWDFDTFDWKMLDSSTTRKESEILSDLKAFQKAKGGKGLILEHDAIQRTVDVGIEIYEKVLKGEEQLTVPLCVGGIDYIKTFPMEEVHVFDLGGK
ncbi:Chitin deacetylase 2 [Candida viswanathii]|uniref:chitin deacetylase n=1 Tax=Candida viswanathii TaxID=5486 RepID=A0A367YBC7_9ASCO|nr:Chitin deacetylase 2 [Candida viswanathii]